jgi:hypothetical protein
MASKLRQSMPGDKEAGAWEYIINSLFQRKLGAAAITDTGEAAMKHLGGHKWLPQ